MKSYKSRKLTILFGITILILLLFIVILIKTKFEIELKRTEEETEVLKKQDEILNEYLEGKIIPRGIYMLISNYEGEVNDDKLYKNLYNVIEYLPNLYNNIYQLNETELKEFYSNNKKVIKKYFGIINEDDFINIAKSIVEYKNTLNYFKYCKIDSDSIDNTNDDYISFNLELFYEGSEKPLKLKVEFANNLYSEIIVKYMSID